MDSIKQVSSPTTRFPWRPTSATAVSELRWSRGSVSGRTKPRAVCGGSGSSGEKHLVASSNALRSSPSWSTSSLKGYTRTLRCAVMEAPVICCIASSNERELIARRIGLLLCSAALPSLTMFAFSSGQKTSSWILKSRPTKVGSPAWS